MMAQQLPEVGEREPDQPMALRRTVVASGRTDHELRGVLILTSTLCQIERAIDHSGSGGLSATRHALAMALKLTATFRAEVESTGVEGYCADLDHLTLRAMDALETAHQSLSVGAIREARDLISAMGGRWIDQFARCADQPAA